MAGFVVGANTSGVYSPAGNTAEYGQTHKLGEVMTTYDGKRWLFVSASTSLTSYQVAAVTSSGYAVPVTTALGSSGINKVGVAQNNISSGSWGWIQILGGCTLSVLSTCSSKVALFTSGTAGSLDDTTSTVKIAGIYIEADITAAANTAAVMVIEPYAAL